MAEEENKLSYEDARTIIDSVRKHFQSQNPQLGYLFFRVDSIRANSKEGVWVVICSFLESLGAQNRIYYKLRVNLNDGSFGDIHVITKERAEEESTKDEVQPTG